jgi:hypothetical protein
MGFVICFLAAVSFPVCLVRWSHPPGPLCLPYYYERYFFLLLLFVCSNRIPRIKFDATGKTEFHRACRKSDVSIEALATFLLSKTAFFEIRAKDKINGRLPIHILCNNLSCGENMLKSLLVSQVLDCYGDRCLMLFFLIFLKELYPESVSVFDREGQTPMHILCDSPAVVPATFKALFDVKPEISTIPDKAENMTPLQKIVENRNGTVDLGHYRPILDEHRKKQDLLADKLKKFGDWKGLSCTICMKDVIDKIFDDDQVKELKDIVEATTAEISEIYIRSFAQQAARFNNFVMK